MLNTIGGTTTPQRRVSRYSFLSKGSDNGSSHHHDHHQQVVELNDPSSSLQSKIVTESKCYYFDEKNHHQVINQYIRNNYDYCVVVEFEFCKSEHGDHPPKHLSVHTTDDVLTTSTDTIKSICFNIVPLFKHSNNSYFYERNKGIIINSEEFQQTEQQLLDVSYPIHIVSDIKETIQMLDQHIISHTQSLLSPVNHSNIDKKSFCFLSTTARQSSPSTASADLPQILQSILKSNQLDNHHHYLVEKTYFINTSSSTTNYCTEIEPQPPQQDLRLFFNKYNFSDNFQQTFPTITNNKKPQSLHHHQHNNFDIFNSPPHTTPNLQLLTTTRRNLTTTNNTLKTTSEGKNLLETIVHFKICEKMAQSIMDTQQQQQDSSSNNSSSTNNCFSTSTAANDVNNTTTTTNDELINTEQQVCIQDSISECLKKPLSINSPSFEPPLHVLQQTIRQERVLFQQVDSPLADEFKTCVVRLRGLPWTSTVQDIAEFFSEFKLAKKEHTDEVSFSETADESPLQPTLNQPYNQINDTTTSSTASCTTTTTTSTTTTSIPSQPTYAAIVSMGVENSSTAVDPQVDSTTISTNNNNTIIEQSCQEQQQPIIKQYKISIDTAKDLDIILMLNYFGKSTGEAYVKFDSEEELERARKTMDKKNLGNRYIEIFKSTIEEMEHSRRVLERNLKNLNNSKILKMRNVPFSATEDEIETFFSGLGIATVQSRNQTLVEHSTTRRKIYFVLNPMHGKRTGEVFVEFTCHDQMLQAAKRNKEKIRNRYIELFQSSISELRASQYYIQQHCYSPYQQQHVPTTRIPQARKSNFIVKIEGLPTGFEENEIAELFNGLSLSEAGIHLIFGEDECSAGEAFVEFVDEESMTRALEKNSTTITTTDENNEDQQNIIQVVATDRTEMLSVCGIEEEEEEQEDESNLDETTTALVPSDQQEETLLDSSSSSNIGSNNRGGHANNGFDYSKRRFYNNNNNNFAYPMMYYVPSYSPYYVTNPYFQQAQSSFRNNLDNTDPTTTGVKQPFKYKLFEHPERTLKMRGLPFSSTEKEIAEFFTGYDFEEDSIRFKMDFKRNRQTGICYIRFRTKTEAERAANERNRCNIGDRYIELFTITPKT